MRGILLLRLDRDPERGIEVLNSFARTFHPNAHSRVLKWGVRCVGCSDEAERNGFTAVGTYDEKSRTLMLVIATWSMNLSEGSTLAKFITDPSSIKKNDVASKRLGYEGAEFVDAVASFLEEASLSGELYVLTNGKKIVTIASAFRYTNKKNAGAKKINVYLSGDEKAIFVEPYKIYDLSAFEGNAPVRKLRGKLLKSELSGTKELISLYNARKRELVVVRLIVSALCAAPLTSITL